MKYYSFVSSIAAAIFVATCAASMLTSTTATATIVPDKATQAPVSIGSIHTFSSRCNRPRVNEGQHEQHGNIWFDAFCHGDDGRLWHAVINLNHCLANRDAVLKAEPGGDFAQSCWDAKLSSSTFMDVLCSTTGDGHPPKAASINLDDITEVTSDGLLKCNNHQGCAWNQLVCIDKPNGVPG
ncbi:hypothetical protein JX265_011778 [Neoarthrinium moseri]|uniref:Cyanovirin-N domain-containing protein n=1 Tax=Neoarthrinium moseri TaxID=1658444 RepID=A0A9Q0AJ79_9PEZI|nr:hypothetical protein JX265_011778 [Neoarthrinium moseri]